MTTEQKKAIINTELQSAEAEKYQLEVRLRVMDQAGAVNAAKQATEQLVMANKIIDGYKSELKKLEKK